MARIFISYSSHDAAFADSLYSALEDAGHEVWMDREKLEGGDTWLQTIQDTIRWSDSVVVVWSIHALDSRWVKAEINFAHAHNKQIIPLQIDETDGSEHIIINSLQVINARTAPLGTVLRKIGIALMSNPEVTLKIPAVESGTPTEAMSAPRAQPMKQRSRTVVMLGVVIVLVVLVGMLPLLRPSELEPLATTLTVAGSVTAATDPAGTLSPTPERITVDALNQWRQTNNLPPLTPNNALNALADSHMRDLRSRPLLDDYDEYVDEAGQDAQAMAEDAGYSGEVMLAVKITDSPSTLAELLQEMINRGGESAQTDYSEVGLSWGSSMASGKYYYVLVLGAPA